MNSIISCKEYNSNNSINIILKSNYEKPSKRLCRSFHYFPPPLANLFPDNLRLKTVWSPNPSNCRNSGAEINKTQLVPVSLIFISRTVLCDFSARFKMGRPEIFPPPFHRFVRVISDLLPANYHNWFRGESTEGGEKFWHRSGSSLMHR